MKNNYIVSIIRIYKVQGGGGIFGKSFFDTKKILNVDNHVRIVAHMHMGAQSA